MIIFGKYTLFPWESCVDFVIIVYLCTNFNTQERQMLRDTQLYA